MMLRDERHEANDRAWDASSVDAVLEHSSPAGIDCACL